VLVLVLLAVVACAKATPTPTPKPTPTATATPTKVAAPTATPMPSGPTASLTMTMPTLYAISGWPALSPFKDWEMSRRAGITEPLFNWTTEGTLDPVLADQNAWTLSEDLTKYQIRIKQGIHFNSPPGLDENFGELTAEDIVFFLNKSNGAVNPESTSGDSGNMAAIWGEARVVDKYTFEIDAVGDANHVGPARLMDCRTSYRSKAAYETMGEEWMKTHAVGTGPFVQVEWAGHVKGVVEAVEDHWRVTPQIKQLTIVEVPELSSQVAMLKTGEADMAYLDFKAVPDLLDEGFVFFDGAGGHVTENISAIFPGNLWEETHAKTGDSLEPWNSPAYAEDYPWIGNPWGDKVPYTDTNNPSGIDDMEQARLVRWALSMAINRDLIIEQIFGGLGGPIGIEYISPAAIGGGWDEKWDVPYDPEKSKEYLEQAGYPNGFDITINSYAAEVGPVALDIADAVTTMWRDVGVNAIQERVDYGAVVAPKLIAREQVNIIMKNCDVFGNMYPLDWPFPPTETSLTRPGWGCGLESPFLAEMNLKMSAEPNKQKRIDMHIEVVDYMWDQMLIAGIVERPNGVVANPDTVASWEAPMLPGAAWNYPEYIVPAK